MSKFNSILIIRYFLLGLFLLCFFTNAYSQDSTKFKLIMKAYSVNPFRTSIQGGIELVFVDKYGFELSYGRRFFDEYEKKSDSTMVSPNGDCFQVEVKRYNKSNNESDIIKGLTTNSYFGLTYKYYFDINNKMAYYAKPDSIHFTGDCYVFERIIQAFEFQAGYILAYKIFSLEGYIGLGVRHRNIVLKNYEFNPKTDSFADGLWPWERPYYGFFPSFSLGFKLNFRIFSVQKK